MDACAHSNAALPNEAKDIPWTVTMHRVAASAAEAAENLENPSASEIALWAEETMKVSYGGISDSPLCRSDPPKADI